MGLCYDDGASVGIGKATAIEFAKNGAKHGIRCVCASPDPVLAHTATTNMKTRLGRVTEP